MSYFFLLGLFFILYLDSRIFKRQDGRLYGEIFRIPALMTGIILGVFLFVIFFFDEKKDIFALFSVSMILPIYLIRRGRYLKSAPFPEGYVGSPRQLISDAYGVILFWAFWMLAASFFIERGTQLFPVLESELGELLVSAVFSSGIALVLIFRACRRFSKEGFLTNIALRKGNQGFLRVAVLPALLGLFFAFISACVIVFRDVQPATPLSEVLAQTHSPVLLGLFLFLAIFIAPLVEEIIFRGYFFHVLDKAKGRRFAIYFIAFIFGFLHVGQYWGDWLAITMVFLLGLTLTILRAWTGSTIASAVAHYVYNGGVTVITFIMLLLSDPQMVKELMDLSAR